MEIGLGSELLVNVISGIYRARFEVGRAIADRLTGNLKTVGIVADNRLRDCTRLGKKTYTTGARTLPGPNTDFSAIDANDRDNHVIADENQLEFTVTKHVQAQALHREIHRGIHVTFFGNQIPRTNIIGT